MGEKMEIWLNKQAHLSPNHIALEKADGTTWTFSQLKEASTRFARQLTQFSVGKGKTIAILSHNDEHIAFAAHASQYLGCVLVLLNTRLTKHELHYQLAQSEVDVLLLSDHLQTEKALDFNAQYTFSEITHAKEADVVLREEINLSDPYTMMFTSGTTGNPKAVVHTYGNHWWSAVSSALNLGLHRDDKWLLTLPMFHIGGFSILMKSVIYGMSVYFLEQYDRDVVARAMSDQSITIASFVTLMLKHYVEDVEAEVVPETLRCILLGGGAVPRLLLDDVERKNIPLFQSYGMTETSSQIVTLSEADARRKLGASGKALFPARMNIVNADEQGVGEIVVQGPMVMNGYYKNDEANKKSFQDGWLHTGDLGYIDEEGFLYVVDRRNDLIISGGENIYPTEIEQVLLTLDHVIDVAVVGKQDETWGQVPVAFIVTDGSFEETGVRNNLSSRLANYKIPKQFIVVEALPRNASNKVMRHKLVERLKEE